MWLLSPQAKRGGFLFFTWFIFFYKIDEGMDTACKSVTFAAEIGTWLDSNRLDLQGQQGEIATWRLYNRLDPYLSLYWKEGIGVGGGRYHL